MNDPIANLARATAAHLLPDYGTTLLADVEAALQARGEARAPDRYVEPATLGGLIVSIATLAWTIYTDLRKKTAAPSPDVMARTVRVQLQETADLVPATRDRIIEVVVSETTRLDNPEPEDTRKYTA
jgi:hypothetical protein